MQACLWNSFCALFPDQGTCAIVQMPRIIVDMDTREKITPLHFFLPKSVFFAWTPWRKVFYGGAEFYCRWASKREPAHFWKKWLPGHPEIIFNRFFFRFPLFFFVTTPFSPPSCFQDRFLIIFPNSFPWSRVPYGALPCLIFWRVRFALHVMRNPSCGKIGSYLQVRWPLKHFH